MKKLYIVLLIIMSPNCWGNESLQLHTYGFENPIFKLIPCNKISYNNQKVKINNFFSITYDSETNCSADQNSYEFLREKIDYFGIYLHNSSRNPFMYSGIGAGFDFGITNEKDQNGRVKIRVKGSYGFHAFNTDLKIYGRIQSLKTDQFGGFENIPETGGLLNGKQVLIGIQFSF